MDDVQIRWTSDHRSTLIVVFAVSFVPGALVAFFSLITTGRLLSTKQILTEVLPGTLFVGMMSAIFITTIVATTMYKRRKI